jgi:hypothetical protein
MAEDYLTTRAQTTVGEAVDSGPKPKLHKTIRIGHD